MVINSKHADMSGLGVLVTRGPLLVFLDPS